MGGVLDQGCELKKCKATELESYRLNYYCIDIFTIILCAWSRGPMTPYTPLNITNIHNIDLIPATPLNIF